MSDRDQPRYVTEESLGLIRWNADGLVPAIAQQWNSGEVLMLAWMNREAVLRTLSTGRATYFSRSRQRLWVKGEASGNFQSVRHVLMDCDSDTLLIAVDQIGQACHTGARRCFDLHDTGPDAS